MNFVLFELLPPLSRSLSGIMIGCHTDTCRCLHFLNQPGSKQTTFDLLDAIENGLQLVCFTLWLIIHLHKQLDS